MDGLLGEGSVVMSVEARMQMIARNWLRVVVDGGGSGRTRCHH
jgi:hypothetical protein